MLEKGAAFVLMFALFAACKKEGLLEYHPYHPEEGEVYFVAVRTVGFKEHGEVDCKWGDGSVACSGRFDMGKEQGRWRYFYKNGQKQWEGDYLDGESHGEWVSWYRSGGEKSRETWVHGRKEGPARYFYENGTLMAQGSYKDDAPSGVWHFFAADGSPTERNTLEEARRAEDKRLSDLAKQRYPAPVDAIWPEPPPNPNARWRTNLPPAP